ncbi:MAG: TonB-dependent receptor [Acidobacteria bacterium]|nr:TonB-dependent receptor [Acidobacteriota bacterium]
MFRGLVAAALVVWVPALAAAQDATLRGGVTDSSGAVVAGAKVVATHTDRGLERTLSTDERGRFVFSPLAPGTYDVLVEVAGFEPVRRTALVLEAGATLDLDLQLQPAPFNEAVSVAARFLRDDRPGAALVLGRDVLDHLTFESRSLQAIVALAPGVVPQAEGLFSADGGRTTTNYVTIDGVSANIGVPRMAQMPVGGVRPPPGAETDTNAAGANAVLGGFGGGSDVIQLEALEQVRVDTSAYPARYGRQSGAQVQLVSRSGTNRFSGSAFEYLRDSRLDARDWFSNATPRARRAPYRQQQFGGVFGGPIARDRAFFFLSYEGRRRDSAPAVRELRVPSLTLRGATTLAPQLVRLLNAYPLPHGPEYLDAQGRPLGAAPFYDASPGRQSSNAYSGKIDYTLGPRLVLSGRWNQGLSDRTSYMLAQLSRNGSDTRTLTINGRSAFGARFLHEWAVNYSRGAADNGSAITDRFDISPITERALLPDFAPESASVSISLPGSIQDYSLGPSVANRQVQVNLVESVSWNTARHSARVGVDVRRLTPTYGPTEYRAIVTFNTIDSLVANRADQLAIGSSDQVQLAVLAFSAYAQDTFQVARRLTIDYGLRWEVNPAPHGLDKPLYTLTGFPDLTALALAPTGAPLYPTRWRELGPRVGAAYRLRDGGARSTILRGAVGLHHDLGTGATAAAARMFPYNRSVRRMNVPFPTDDRAAQAAPPLSLDPPYRAQDFTIVDARHALPRTWEWSAGIDHAFRADRLSATYTGRAGRRLLRRYFYGFDVARPVNPAFPAARLNITRNDPGWGDTSDYHALQLQYARRLSGGLQALASYTLARATDSGSDDATVNLADSATRPTYYYGYSRFDRRHMANVSAMYLLPAAPVARALLRDWSINVTVYAQSAPPLNVTYAYRDPIDNMLYSYRVDVAGGEPLWIADGRAPGGRRLNPTAFRPPASAFAGGGRNQVGHGNEIRNSVRGFATWQADVALQRQLPFGGRRAIFVRAEAYNVFNHPNFAQPDASIGTVVGATGQFIPSALFGRANGSGGFGALGGGIGPVSPAGGARTIQLVLRLNF